MLSPRLALDKGPERIFLDLDDPGDLSHGKIAGPIKTDDFDPWMLP